MKTFILIFFLFVRFENQKQMSQVELKCYLQQRVIYKNQNSEIKEMGL